MRALNDQGLIDNRTTGSGIRGQITTEGYLYLDTIRG